MNDRQIFMNAPDGASPEELARYLDRACGQDGDLRSRVDALFEGGNKAGAMFMGVPPAEGVQLGVGQSPVPRNDGRDETVIEAERALLGIDGSEFAESEGAVIGNYKLLKRIGEGGFGVVFEADQLRPVKRRVALKIIRIGMDTGPVVARFKLERQALALMDHPSIAKVFDAGAAESGRPFFVMELVHGVPITDFCDENNLSTAARLELFVEVCMAVQHAHLKCVIHRDLKPSNILVTEVDGTPTPKIIDFGIAKATQAALMDETLMTRDSEMIGTPEYMSPEQAGSAGFDVDTRCDVYSLGATLYQLITGVPPIKLRGEKVAVDEMFRRVREEVPALPSLRLASSIRDTTAEEHAEKLGLELSSLQRRVSGDLDWIILKALEKQRQRRYQRPEDLAQDLRAYLTNRPVSARAPSLLYRTEKLVQRHRGAFKLAAACLVVAAISMLVLARARAEDRAQNKAHLYLQTGSGHARELLSDLQISRPSIRLLLEESPGTRGKIAIAKFEPDSWKEIEPALWTAPSDELPLFLDVAGGQPSLRDAAWATLSDVTARRATRLNAAAVLARFEPQNPHWESLADQLVSLMVVEKAGSIGQWIELLRPVQNWLVGPLAELVADAQASQLGTLASAIARVGDAGVERLGQEAATPLPEGSAEIRNAAAKGRARQALMQLRLGDSTAVLRLLQRELPDDPRLQSYIVHGLVENNLDPNLIFSMAKETGRADVRRALLEALGGFDLIALGGALQQSFSTFILEEFQGNPDAGIHSTCEWLLRKWGLGPGFVEAREISGAAWSIHPEGPTMVVPGGGAPRRFAIASTHVSIAQFRRFDLNLKSTELGRDARNGIRPPIPLEAVAPNEDCPIVYINATAAMQYCNWLSLQAGLPQAQWCYVTDDGGERLGEADGFLARTGYRLPTEKELELAIRGGSTSALPWGSDLLLAQHYYAFNRDGLDGIPPMQACGLLRPNAYGLFDGLGLALQLCHAGDGENGNHALRGTSMMMGSDGLYIEHRATTNLMIRDGLIVSFRVARTRPN